MIRGVQSAIRLLGHLYNWTRVQDDILLLPFEKRERLANIAKHFQVSAFVETGSYRGETAVFMSQFVSVVISVEIDPLNSEFARQACAGLANVKIHTGRSEDILPSIIESLNGAVLFWLDAHYQTGMIMGRRRCPIFDELAAILARRQIEPIIVIDDARKFIWVNGWPSLNSIKKFVMAKRNDLSFRISSDMICIGKFSM